MDGTIRFLELLPQQLQTSFESWKSLIWGQEASSSTASSTIQSARMKERYGSNSEEEGQSPSSIPKTGTSGPKIGRHDPDNTPHVGGNTWAGGTGGSDTAGLGGRGGPYRLDAGHQVHQISEAAKAEVSQEAKEKARKMAQVSVYTTPYVFLYWWCYLLLS